MWIILSDGQFNIFNLAKSAGMSVEQIERFYPCIPASRQAAGGGWELNEQPTKIGPDAK